MAKGAYIGVDGIARKIKKGYVGVDGVARRIKKAYIGIGGIARPCWSSGELEYYGTITGLSEAKMELAATTVGGYALFGGGGYYVTETAMYSSVDAYNETLTKTTATSLSEARGYLAATTVGNYALFGGGASDHTSSSYTVSNTVDAYTM